MRTALLARSTLAAALAAGLFGAGCVGPSPAPPSAGSIAPPTVRIRVRPYRLHALNPPPGSRRPWAKWLEGLEYDVHVAVTETSVGEFRAFCLATGRALPAQPDGSTDDHPVVNVSRADAEAYCRWRGGRLPSAQEWEDILATRGKLGWEATWVTWDSPPPPEDDAERIEVLPVGTRLWDRSPDGLRDVAANAREWLGETYPYPVGPGNEESFVGWVRRPSANGRNPFEPESLDIAWLSAEPSDTRSPTLGFRVCFGPAPPPWEEPDHPGDGDFEEEPRTE